MSETWLLNYMITLSTAYVSPDDVPFTSNGKYYKSLACFNMNGIAINYYGYESTADIITVYKASTGWSNDAYRTITFDEPVTDTTLLAWLQANGTKQ